MMQEPTRRNEKIAALILAAGYSSRMGRLKPLLSLEGRSLVEEAVSRFLQAGVEDVRVVVGHNSAQLTPLLDRLGVTRIFNADYGKGMLSSILAGTGSLGPEVEAFFVLPVDTPLVKPKTIESLVEAYRSGRAKVVYPRFLGERGHPPLVSVACVTDLPVELEGGLRAHLGGYEAESLDVDVIDQAVVMDCDTKDQYRLLQEYRSREDVPTVQECEAIWNRFGTGEGVTVHCRVVAELARLLAVHLNRAGFHLNIALIVAAGLLHDLMREERDHARAGAAVLRQLGYPRVADVVSSHMDILLDQRPLDETALVYLADKCVAGDRTVRLEERFERSLAKFSSNPEALKAIARRLKDARRIKERLEYALDVPLEDIVRKYSKGLQLAAGGGLRTIYLARHGALRLNGQGKYYIGQLDIPLSGEGVRQAESLRDQLRGVPFSGIFCSDLKRSLATAEILAEPHAIEISVRQDLREIALGRWEGLSFDQVRSRHPEAYRERGLDIVCFRPPGGESFMDLTCRVIPALLDMLRSTRGNLLIVGHAGVNRVLLCHVLGKSLDELFEIEQAYGCLNEINVKELQFDLRALNQIHDPPKGDWNGRSSGSREVQGTAQAESA